MRCFILAALLLLCPVSQAAIINPIGGSWTDGATVAEYVELEPLANGRRRWRTFLTAENGSHVLAEAFMTSDRYITFDMEMDFHDGMADISGEFEFYATRPVDVAAFPTPTLDAFVNGEVPAERHTLLPPGTHTISWKLTTTPFIGMTHRSWASFNDIPEPSAAWLLLLGVPLWWWRRG